MPAETPEHKAARIAASVAAKAAKRAASEARTAAGEAAIRARFAGMDGNWTASLRPKTALERQHARRAAGRELGELPRVRHRRVRESCRLSLLRFGLVYCLGPGKFLARPPSPRMQRFVESLQERILHGGNKHVRWPRGKGKSTWVKIAALWALVYGHRSFVVVLAAVKAMAEQAVAEIWDFAAEDPRFAADFPEVAVPLADVAMTPQRMRVQTYFGKKTHVTDNSRFAFKRFAMLDGIPNTGGIMAWRGADQAVRGLNIGSRRPDFIFIDDPQTDEQARNPSTVSKIEDNILGAVMGLGSTGETISAVMASTPIEPDDVSERFADPDRHPEWDTTTETFVVSWGPDEWVQKYLRAVRNDDVAHDAERTESRQLYALHRAEIERGAEMMDDGDFSPDKEASAYQHALNLLHLMKRKRFDSEMQMRPTRSQGVYKLSPAKISACVNGYPMAVVPPPCTNGLVAFCDVNAEAGLRWGVMAFGPNRVTAIVAYGKYPEKGRLYPDGTAEGAIPAILSAAIRRVAHAIFDTPFRTTDGEAVRVSGICFDGGWQTETVAKACDGLNAALGAKICGWSKGFNWRGYRPGKAPPEARGEFCHVSTDGKYGPFLAFHADYWREIAQTAFMNAPLTPSSCSFWGDDKIAHYDFAAETCAEELVAKFTRPDNLTQWDWKKTGPNHYGDVAYGCMVFGSKRGLFDSAASIVGEAFEGEDFERMKSGKLKRRKSRYVYKR